MAANPALKTLVDQSIDSIGATVLSSVASALRDYVTAADLVAAPNRAFCTEVLRRLVTIANDGGRNTTLRVLSLECIYWVSRVQDDAFRQRELFNVVQQLNQSFDDLLQREAAALGAQREMLTVVLLRCTGYTRLKAGDVLQQLCGGDDRVMTTLLLSILRNRGYEWALLQAAMRCLYELTTPSSYFNPDQTVETTKVTAFQAKIVSFISHCMQDMTVTDIFNELAERWKLSTANQCSTGGTEGLGLAGDPSTLSSVPSFTPGQHQELLQWSAMMRMASIFVDNLVSFCGDAALVRDFQQSLTAGSQGFLATVVVPYTMAAFHYWEKTRTEADVHAHAIIGASNNPCMNAAMAALQLLRISIYKPRVALEAPLTSALSALAQQVTRLEPFLRSEYVGMLAMIYTVECLCNVNARTITAPVNLAGSLEVLLSTIANDKAPLRLGARCTTAQGFAICFSKEESPFCVMSNESTALLHERFAKEEAELQEDVEAFEAIERLEEQLDALQAMIMQIAIGQLLGELAMTGVFPNATGSNPYARSSGAAPEQIEAAPSTTAAASGNKKKKKQQHPAKYCCQLTGKLMKEPVVLKNGHHFEYDALQDVVERVGHVDPISGEAVDEAIEVDGTLQQEIAQYRATRAVTKQ